MAEFIPAKHDVVFKALFVYHHDILAAFLHDVLDLPITVKSHIDVKNPEIIPVYADGKTCRLDIHVETENRKFNVEMQSRADGFSTERVLYYWSKMFIAELETGEKYELLEQTYSINVLGFKHFDCDEYHSSFSYWKIPGIKSFLTSCPSTFSSCRKCRRRSILTTRNSYGCI